VTDEEAAFFFVRSALSPRYFTDADCWRIVRESE